MHQEYAATATRRRRLHDPWRLLAGPVCRHQAAIFHRQHERLRHNVELLEAAQMLHLDDVLVQAIFARQLRRARKMVDALVRLQRAQHIRFHRIARPQQAERSAVRIVAELGQTVAGQDATQQSRFGVLEAIADVQLPAGHFGNAQRLQLRWPRWLAGGAVAGGAVAGGNNSVGLVDYVRRRHDNGSHRGDILFVRQRRHGAANVVVVDVVVVVVNIVFGRIAARARNGSVAGRQSLAVQAFLRWRFDGSAGRQTDPVAWLQHFDIRRRRCEQRRGRRRWHRQT